jgi:hypothetical protein
MFLSLKVFLTRVLKHLYHLFHEELYQSAVNFTAVLAPRALANFETNDLSSNVNREGYTESCVDRGNPLTTLHQFPSSKLTSQKPVLRFHMNACYRIRFRGRGSYG